VLRRISSRPPAEAASPGDDDEDGPPRAPAKLPAKAGLNRFAWDLRLEEASRFPGLILWSGELRGPVVPPGRYQVRLTAAGQTFTEPLEVRKDPRLSTTDADFAKQYDLLRKIRDKLTETHDAVARIRAVREQVNGAAARAKTTPAAAEVAAAAEALEKKLTAVEEALYQTRNRSSQDPLNFPIRLNNKLAALARAVGSADAAPTEQSYAVYEDLLGKIDAELATLARLVESDLARFNQLVRERDVPAVVPGATKA
jgi:ferritin-like metal-binding protein YciE